MYGETSFELVDQMIRTIDFTTEDKFIDLGSGMFSLLVISTYRVLYSVCLVTTFCVIQSVMNSNVLGHTNLRYIVCCVAQWFNSWDQSRQLKESDQLAY